MPDRGRTWARDIAQRGELDVRAGRGPYDCSMLELRFSGLYEEGGRADRIPEVDVSASEFSIVVDGKTLYSEPHMTVIELLGALTSWLRVPAESRSDFEFESMSTDERGLVWIKTTNGRYRIGSVHQAYEELRELSESEIRAAVEQFRDRLLVAAHRTLGFNLRDYVPNMVDPL